MNKRGDLSQTPKNFDEIEGSPANTETLPKDFVDTSLPVSSLTELGNVKDS